MENPDGNQEQKRDLVEETDSLGAVSTSGKSNLLFIFIKEIV